jgi:hypothetical protein
VQNVSVGDGGKAIVGNVTQCERDRFGQESEAVGNGFRNVVDA